MYKDSKIIELNKGHIIGLINQYYIDFNERGLQKILAEDTEGTLLHYFTEHPADLADLFLNIEAESLEDWFDHYFNPLSYHYIFRTSRGYHVIVMPEYKDLNELQ